MPPLEISLLRSFVAVIRLGSISAAALQIGRTQSALSTQMKRLEQIVGGEVFHRSGSGVSPTRLGERLMTHAQTILAAHDEALSDLSGQGLQGSVSLGCPEDYLNAFIPSILSRFAAEHPAVEIEIACAPTSELKPMLHRRQVDVALLSETMDTIPTEPLRRTKLVWIASEPCPQALQGEVLPLALAAPNTLDHQIACEAVRRAERPYRIAFAASSLTGLLAIARSGHAVSVVTDTAVPDDLFVINDPLPALPEVGIYLERSAAQPGEVLEEFCRVTSEVVQSTRT
ncbi:MAG: LysR family transcriptional regulator [Pseudomonadota bacterium]